MNTQYLSTIIDYIDRIHCSFEYDAIPPEIVGYTGIPFTSIRLAVLHSPEKVNWKHLSLSATATTLQWLEKHFLERIDWNALVVNSAADETFWERHLDTLDWERAAMSSHLGDMFWERHIDRVPLQSLVWNNGLSQAFWERDSRLTRVDWFGLAANPHFSVQFWKEHYDQLNAQIACLFNSSLDETFWRWVLSTGRAVSFSALSKHPTLSESFWREHVNSIHWLSLCRQNRVLSLSFWEEHLENVHWLALEHNPSVPKELFARQPLVYDDSIEDEDDDEWFKFPEQVDKRLRIELFCYLIKN
jgi:hypothetical protein